MAAQRHSLQAWDLLVYNAVRIEGERKLAVIIALASFALILISILGGLFLRYRLPDSHLSGDSKDVIRLATALIGTMAAVVENSGPESVLAMATPFSTTVASLVGGASTVATFSLADIAVQDCPSGAGRRP